jgi:hypothetical protein
LKLRTSSAEANAVEHVERLCSELDPGLLADRKVQVTDRFLFKLGNRDSFGFNRVSFPMAEAAATRQFNVLIRD